MSFGGGVQRDKCRPDRASLCASPSAPLRFIRAMPRPLSLLPPEWKKSTLFPNKSKTFLVFRSRVLLKDRFVRDLSRFFFQFGQTITERGIKPAFRTSSDLREHFEWSSERQGCKFLLCSIRKYISNP